MKNRIIALLLVMVTLVLCFASCGKKNKDKDQGDKPDQQTTNSNYPWSETTLIFSINEDSDTDQLPSSSRRYLAGDLTGNESDADRVDDYVSDRNDDAKAATNINVEYQYLPDDSDYGWGKNGQYFVRNTSGGNPKAPDVFVNFVYDMVAASLKNCFANLYSTTMHGANHEWSNSEHNYFEFEDVRANFQTYQDTGKNYMFKYMKSLTLSTQKMYCLSSDYFVDMVRAFFVVPVNIEMLEGIGVAKNEETQELVAGQPNSDRNGDGKFDIQDFYDLVWDYEWNYDALAYLADAVARNTDNEEGIGLGDTVGFALGTGSGLAASGMLYTTSVTIIKDDQNASGDYTYSYPNIKKDITGQYVIDKDSNDTTYQKLTEFCNNLADLVELHDGVITVSADQAKAKGYKDDPEYMRKKFADNKLLFGGVIVLGGLEHEDYVSMKGEGKKGYGIVPVPFYHSDLAEDEVYQTQIHNNGKIGAISYATSKFAQCTAYLNYQCTNSNKVLTEYYTHKLRQTVKLEGGYDHNGEMLTYIRENVRSSFDKAFEDALGAYYNAQTDGKSDKSKWHSMIKDNNFILRDMSNLYAQYAPTKATWLEDLEKNIYPYLPS